MRALHAVAALSVALAAACGRGPGESSAPVATGAATEAAPGAAEAAAQTAAPRRADYLCGETVARIVFSGDGAELMIDGRAGVIALAAAPAASGARYVGEGAEFHTKGDRAILTLNGVAAPECVALAAASEDAAPAADIFRARGNEPGWSLTLGPDRFTFTADYGEKIVSGRSPAPVAEGEALVFSSAEHELEIRIEDRLCTDDATGMPHPKTVAASLDGRTYAGCGGAPADLLVGDWRLVEIDGEAVADGIEATMAFAADGRVAGRAACNRYSAQWTLTGESLSIGPAAATKMACLDETAAQTEQRFFAILPSADRFGVEPEGALIIYAADRPILKARR